MTHADHTEQELYDAVRDIIERIPFNRMLGIRLISAARDRASIGIEMRPEFIGNYVRGALHGGVISSVLDVTGGLVALLGAMNRTDSRMLQDKVARFEKLGTIDLRVDYLRPGEGQRYVSSGYLLRTGNRVAVTRMELHDESATLIAVGTAAYVVA